MIGFLSDCGSQRDVLVSLRVSWRYARGVISSDDSLFDRWKAPDLHRVVLDPVREKDAGKHTWDGFLEVTTSFHVILR